MKTAELFRAIARLRNESEVAAFFEDLCTPTELESMADRWQVAALVAEGLPYRKINEMTGVSTATITRVARCLTDGSGGYNLLLKRTAK